MKNQRLERKFFVRDVLSVAPDLLGKHIVRKYDDGSVIRYSIREVEAYRGIEDLACHASKGRTKRTDIMYHSGGKVYVYLIYGMYWMLNFVTGEKEIPQAALIRAVEGFDGPGKITQGLNIDGSFYGEDLLTSSRIWLENSDLNFDIVNTERIGIDYSGKPWKSKPWRFVGKRQ